jgi:hypothetical protein
MKARLLSLIAIAVMLSGQALAQTAGGQIDTVFNPNGDVWPPFGLLLPNPPDNRPAYNPTAFPLPNGNLGVYVQGNCLGSCQSGNPALGDSLFLIERNAATDTWIEPVNPVIGAVPSAGNAFTCTRSVP